MDKPNKGSTITIKINGKERPMKNKQESIREQEKAKSATANHVEMESAAAKEAAEEGEFFEWILPTEPDNGAQEERAEEGTEPKEKQPEKFPFMKNKGKKMNPEKRKWITTIFFIVLCAVIVGTIFGLTMLKMVLPDGGSDRSEPVVQQVQPITPSAAGGSNDIDLPPLTTYVVQAGIYSAKETAQKEQERLKNKGIPAQVIDMENLDMSGKFALFIGVSNNITGAKTVSQERAAEGIETFAKEITVGKKTVKGISGEEGKLLEMAPQLFQTITVNVNDLRASAKVSPENQAALAKQEKVLAEINKDKLKNEKAVQLYSEAAAASSQFKKYADKPDNGTETTVQQHLLTILALYLEL